MDLSKIHFRREPALWIGLAVAILQISQAFFNHQPIDATMLNTVFIAFGALTTRKFVTPNTTNNEDGNAESDPAGR